jgi:hypothetical protein
LKPEIATESHRRVKQSKQTTLDSTPYAPKEKDADVISQASKKAKEIVDAATCTREDDLEFKVAFKLMPSNTAFSRMGAEMQTLGFGTNF